MADLKAYKAKMPNKNDIEEITKMLRPFFILISKNNSDLDMLLTIKNQLMLNLTKEVA